MSYITKVKNCLVFMIASFVWAGDEMSFAAEVELGPRPYFLVDQMRDGELKEKLRSCERMNFKKSDFSIGHRGAPLQFPEHTSESYQAAARMGAGILECDVTFTKDKELVCRHSQNDLHTTTNILLTPLAKNCTSQFSPADDENPASAECRVSDLTKAEFKSLTGKMDGANNEAESVEEYVRGTAGWRTDLYAQQSGSVMTHADSIELFKELGVKFTPELKAPVVEMPFDGLTQESYAQKLIDEYKDAGVSPSMVWPQSFNLNDVLYWIENEPEFGKQAVFLDSRFRRPGFDHNDPVTFQPTMIELKSRGVNYLAPPLWMLLTVEDGEMVPSAYAIEAREAGLKIITWTFERSGSLQSGGGWYYQSVKELLNGDGSVYEVLHVLAKEAGVIGVFSDWPATVTYYANCFGYR